MAKIANEYEARGVVFIGVGASDTKENLEAFVREFKWEFPVGHDTTGRVGDAFGFKAFPTKAFIDRDGNLVEKVEGALPAAELRAKLDRLLQ